jgi:hypothetical protein
VFVFRAWFGDLGTQFGRLSFNVIASSLKTRFRAPEPLVIWAQLHAASSNLTVYLRAGPEPLAEPSREGRALVCSRAVERCFRAISADCGLAILTLGR